MPRSAAIPRITTVSNYFERGREVLKLSAITPIDGHQRPLTSAQINSADLALTGFIEEFPAQMLQYVGHQACAYLNSLPLEVQIERWYKLFEQQVPAVVLSSELTNLETIVELADQFEVALFKTAQQETLFYRLSSIILYELTCPQKILHGTLVDVGGIGVLLMGDSGIGKSETALGLIRHGCALISDDYTIIQDDGTGCLIGQSPTSTHGFIEIRGLGVLNVPTLFGIGAIRDRIELDLIIKLKHFSAVESPERMGLDTQTESILGVNITCHTIPVIAGKDFVNIVETAVAELKTRRKGQCDAALLESRLKFRNLQMKEAYHG